MKNDILDQIHQSSSEILNAPTTKKLESAIVENAKKISTANYVQLYFNKKDRLKKIYSSDNEIKKCTIVKMTGYKKNSTKNDITPIPASLFDKWNIDHLPEDIQMMHVLPLNNKDHTLGFIIFFHVQKSELDEAREKALRILCQTAILAMTKMHIQDESKKALDIRDRFISLASHELRTPLTSLHGYIQLLHARMSKNDTVEGRWVKELHVESIRLTTLVKELLDVNRIKQGQFAFVFSEVQMQEVITRAIEHQRLTSAEHTIVVQNKMDQDAKVIGDFDKLVEMVSGLLGNAIKFSRPEETIVVLLKSFQGGLSLTVKDTGKGISKKDLTAVFDGFYKSSHASHLEGMGVGLLLAKHIVENHRGKIKITSKENKGTKVEVTLPAIKAIPL